MKGLLYNDLITNKSNFLAILIVLAYIILGGYLSVDLSSDAELNSSMHTLLNSSIIAISLAFPLVTLECGNESAKNNWTQYAAALPGGYKRLIFEKYMLCIMGSASGFILNTVLIFVFKIFFDVSVKVPFLFLLFMNGIMLIIQAILLPLFLGGKSNIASIIIISTIVLSLFLIFTYIALCKLPDTNDGLINSIINLLTLNHTKLCVSFIIINILGGLLMGGSYKITSINK